MAFQRDAFQGDAFEGDAFEGGAFSVRAVLTKPDVLGGPFPLDAWLITHPAGSLTVEAFVAPVFRVDAVFTRPVAETFTVAAEIVVNVGSSFGVDANVFGVVTASTLADAWVTLTTYDFSLTADAVLFGARQGGAAAAAWINVPGSPAGGTLLDAVIAATPSRLYQLPVEVIHAGDSEARLYQLPVEVIHAGDSEARLYQLPVEVIHAGDSEARLYQLPVEVIYRLPFAISVDAVIGFLPFALVSQAGFETAWQPDSAALVSQSGTEVAWRSDSDGLVAQAGLETALAADPYAVISQIGLEAIWLTLGNAQVAQTGFEVVIEKPKGTFPVNAMFFRPWEYMPPVTQTIDAALVWRLDGDPWTADAFIQWYMALDAVRFQPGDEKAFTLNAALIIRQYDSFTLNAFTQGFLLNAVIEASGWYGSKQGIFNVYAVKGRPFFLADAWIVGTPDDFTADAVLRLPVSASTTVSAWVIDFWWNKVRTFAADALIQPGVSTVVADKIWVEACVSLDERTVTYDGEGETHVERHLVTERLEFPGFPNPAGGKGTELSIDNANNLFGPLVTIDGYPVTVTLFEMSTWGDRSIGVHGPYQNHWSTATGPGSYEFWPADDRYESFVYTSHGGLPYDSSLTGSGLVSFHRDDTIVDALPAPTLDAWIVGTVGEPATIDAEIVGTEKLRGLYADAWVNDEINWQFFTVNAYVLVTEIYFFFISSVIADRHLSVDAVIHQPSLSVDAFIRPSFKLNATILKTFTPVTPSTGKGPTLDAVVVRGTKSWTTTADAYLFPESGWGVLWSDAVITKTMTTTTQPGPQRFYLAATIGHLEQGFSLDAFIGHQFQVSAYIQPNFTVSAHIRGSSYIIFPEDGGPPTDPFGNLPMIGRSFKIKIEAGIADPIPIGNDAEIERLITLIIEAEAELEALYCAVTHYTSQDATSTGGHSNTTGTGSNRGSLPGVISQVGYPGAGDIDDCWLVATVWAAIAAGETYKPSATVFRSYAGNPDRPGPTGGTLDHVMRGARGCWPNHRIRRYQSTNWDGFVSMLRAGWTASLAVGSRALPSNLRFGFYGRHQIGVAYQDGRFWVANPLASNGSRPKEISGLELRTAARAFTGGTISAALFR